MVTNTQARIDIRAIGPRDLVAAARVLTDAFMTAATWEAVGPKSMRHRRVALLALYLADIVIGLLRRGIVLGAFRGDRLEGVLIAFPDGERLVPWWGWLLRSVACLVAGPRALVRALRLVAGLDAMHPKEPHVFYSILGRRADAVGVGYALSRAALARGDELDRPGYVEVTADAELVAMNELLGWTKLDQHVLPTGRVITTMWRDRP
ncbi:MAG: hypothetical protein GEV28_33730 [Actinophytocola sp.]|uniref:hypothetical protein n=1 Tax=Actinophytocola sp. TaxID=1872138 RepID=UPI0013299A2A|nr:hypothetical protein [Actinophytocola sp.]MPZ85082.1 hypothetical protein [Actinophytocola sp.]